MIWTTTTATKYNEFFWHSVTGAPCGLASPPHPTPALRPFGSIATPSCNKDNMCQLLFPSVNRGNLFTWWNFHAPWKPASVQDVATCRPAGSRGKIWHQLGGGMPHALRKYYASATCQFRLVESKVKNVWLVAGGQDPPNAHVQTRVLEDSS